MARRKDPHAVALGRRGGKAKSAVKAAAVRVNGKLGGRRPKFEPGDRIIGRETAPTAIRQRAGHILARTTGRNDYRVAFNEHDIRIVKSWWIEKRR